MIIKTINQSWAIPESMINRYGKNWASIDFEINPKVSNYAFRNDPLNTTIGQVCLCNKRLDANLKQLNFNTNVSTFSITYFLEVCSSLITSLSIQLIIHKTR